MYKIILVILGVICISIISIVSFHYFSSNNENVNVNNSPTQSSPKNDNTLSKELYSPGIDPVFTK